MRLRLANTTKPSVVLMASDAISSTCKIGFSFLVLLMMPSSRRPRLVFLLGGGDGGLRRWSLLTPLVEAPTGDITSSSLNGFSLRDFSGHGPSELDIFDAGNGAISGNRGCYACLRIWVSRICFCSWSSKISLIDSSFSDGNRSGLAISSLTRNFSNCRLRSPILSFFSRRA